MKTNKGVKEDYQQFMTWALQRPDRGTSDTVVLAVQWSKENGLSSNQQQALVNYVHGLNKGINTMKTRKLFVKGRKAVLLKAEGDVDPELQEYLEGRGLDDVTLEDAPPTDVAEVGADGTPPPDAFVAEELEEVPVETPAAVAPEAGSTEQLADAVADRAEDLVPMGVTPDDALDAAMVEEEVPEEMKAAVKAIARKRLQKGKVSKAAGETFKLSKGPGGDSKVEVFDASGAYVDGASAASTTEILQWLRSNHPGATEKKSFRVKHAKGFVTKAGEPCDEPVEMSEDEADEAAKAATAAGLAGVVKAEGDEETDEQKAAKLKAEQDARDEEEKAAQVAPLVAEKAEELEGEGMDKAAALIQALQGVPKRLRKAVQKLLRKKSLDDSTAVPMGYKYLKGAVDYLEDGMKTLHKAEQSGAMTAAEKMLGTAKAAIEKLYPDESEPDPSVDAGLDDEEAVEMARKRKKGIVSKASYVIIDGDNVYDGNGKWIKISPNISPLTTSYPDEKLQEAGRGRAILFDELKRDPRYASKSADDSDTIERAADFMEHAATSAPTVVLGDGMVEMAKRLRKGVQKAMAFTVEQKSDGWYAISVIGTSIGPYATQAAAYAAGGEAFNKSIKTKRLSKAECDLAKAVSEYLEDIANDKGTPPRISAGAMHHAGTLKTLFEKVAKELEAADQPTEDEQFELSMSTEDRDKLAKRIARMDYRMAEMNGVTRRLGVN